MAKSAAIFHSTVAYQQKVSGIVPAIAIVDSDPIQIPAKKSEN
ncbi:MAG: hypothetical protein Q4F81_04380 [Eubacteriales bacterium]|nr:hypothetical protein [Eubacteriales bacterium]